MFSMSMRCAASTCRRLSLRANFTFASIERPMSTIFRCCSSATSMICWTRWIWLAKQATTMRRSGRSRNSRRSAPPDRALRRGEARLLGVGRIGEEQGHALVAEGRESRDVGSTTVDGRQVEFEVARVHEDAGVGEEGQRHRTRYRVRDGDELDVEGADLATFAVGDFDEGEVLGDLGLGEAVSGEAEGQRPSRRSAR